MSQILPTRAEKAAFEKQKKPLVFMILDGWGIAPKTCANAILTGKTCNMCSLMQNYPTTQLMASGESVGLPEGQRATVRLDIPTSVQAELYIRILPASTRLSKIDPSLITRCWWMQSSTEKQFILWACFPRAVFTVT